MKAFASLTNQQQEPEPPRLEIIAGVTWESFNHLDDAERDPYPHLAIGDVIRHADRVPGREEYTVGEIHAVWVGGRPRTLTCKAYDARGREVSVINVVNWFRRVSV